MDEKKRNGWLYLLPLLFGVIGGILGALVSLDDEIFAMKQMVVGLTVTVIVMALSVI